MAREHGQDWKAAARWLEHLEQHAREAEREAKEAVAAAERADWPAAEAHGYRAWALEFASGRGVWRGFPLNWQPLREAIEASMPKEALACEGA
jgi:hypothetical protein